jgi:hypothetical protein
MPLITIAGAMMTLLASVALALEAPGRALGLLSRSMACEPPIASGYRRRE